MRKLLDFLLRKLHWLVFIILELISFALIYQDNAYQRNVMISSANVITGHIASVSGNVTSYLNLREINKDLLERNGQLELRILELQDQLELIVADSVVFSGFLRDSVTPAFPYDFTLAKVVNNSVSRLSNYITINKGTSDGINPGMGVVSERGVVGIVSTTLNRFSVVIPLINPKLRLSCKVAGSSYFGSFNWDGRDSRYASLNELPRHVEFNVGDTIVTSGYSSVFPEGVIVGTIAGYEPQRDDNFYSLQIELTTDFHALNNVRVITNYSLDEQQQVEQRAQQNDQ